MAPSRHRRRALQAPPGVREAALGVGSYRPVDPDDLLFAPVMSLSDKKCVLDPRRVRRLPRQGWSWIDRRFLREHAPHLGHDAIVLYLFLAAVADRHGVSFYGEGTVAALLRVDPARLAVAREELLSRDLVAYRAPTAQVLSLPEPQMRAPSTPTAVGELLRRLARGES